MYYLPFSPRTRFCALPDTLTIRTSLEEFLVVGRTWDEFLTKYSVDLVPGVAQTGISFERGNTFVTDEVGYPQILFEGAPGTLLFVYSHYASVSSGSSFSYGELAPGYVRRAIDSTYLEGSPPALESVLERLGALEQGRTSNATFNTLENRVDTAETAITRLNQRQDPLEVVLPYLSSERQTRYQKDADLQQQIDSLQIPVSERTLELTNYYDKAAIDNLLSELASLGYVDTKYNVAAKQTDLDDLAGRTEAAEGTLEDLNQPVVAYDGITVINQATFMLSLIPERLVMVFINGELQAPDSYTVVGDLVTLDAVRPAGDRVIVVAG